MELNINLNLVICIDLRKNRRRHLSPTRIKFIAQHFSLDPEILLKLREKYHKIWVYLEDEPLLMYGEIYERMYDYSTYISWSPFGSVDTKTQNKILNMPPTPIPPTPKQKAEPKQKTTGQSLKKPVKLELDSILDKINETGLSSLTKDELNFLDNYKND